MATRGSAGGCDVDLLVIGRIDPDGIVTAQAPARGAAGRRAADR